MVDADGMVARHLETYPETMAAEHQGATIITQPENLRGKINISV
jgi:hypothetical protein